MLQNFRVCSPLALPDYRALAMRRANLRTAAPYGLCCNAAT